MTDNARTIWTGTARVVRWWLALTVAVALLVRANSGALGGADAWAWWVDVAVGRAAPVLTFVLYVAGLAAAASHARVRSALRLAIGIAVLFALGGYVVQAYVGPHAEAWRAERSGVDVSQSHPEGAFTPPTLLRVRASVRASPPDQYSFSVEEPLRRPPNWLLYLVLQPLAAVLLGVANAGLGVVVGHLTSGLDPPARRRRRWTIGLAAAVVFFAPVLIGASWVQSSPTHSALAGAGLPLLVPLTALALGWRKLSARRPPAAGGPDA